MAKTNKEIENLYSFINAYKNVDKSLEDTKYCIDNKIKIHYAVDWSEVLAYISPNNSSQDKALASGLWESENKQKIRERLILHSIFNQPNSLIILPPHLVELRNYLKKSLNDIENNTFTKEQISEIEKNIHSNRDLKSIELIYNECRKEERSLTKHERLKVISYVKKNFDLLKYSETFTKIMQLKLLSQMIDSGKLIGLDIFFDKTGSDFIKFNSKFEDYAKFYYKEYRDALNYHYQKSIDSSNEEDFDSLRNKKYLDSLALSYIESINYNFSNDINVKHMLAFTSRDEKMLELLNDFGSVKFDKRWLSSSRNMESMKQVIDIESSSESLERFKFLDSLLEELEEFEIQLKEYINEPKPSFNLKDTISKDIKNTFTKFHQKSNIDYFLFENEMAELKKYLPENLGKNYEKIQSLISLVTANQLLKEELIDDFKDSSKLSNHINRIVVELKNFDVLIKEKQLESKESRSCKKSNFFGFGDEMDLNINLMTREGDRVTQMVFNNKETVQRSIIILNGVSFSQIKKRESEILIVASYLYAVSNRNDEALELLKELENRSIPEEILNEALIVKLIIFRRENRFTDGFEICNKILNSSKRDPRILHQLGILMWQALNSGEDINKISDIYKLEISKAEIINITKESFKNSGTNESLKINCINSLAYYYSEFDMLKSASSFIVKLESYMKLLEKNNSVPPRFYDTVGFYYYKKCFQFVNDKRVRTLLEQAITNFKIAVYSSSKVLYERELYLEHYNDAKMELRDWYFRPDYKKKMKYK